MKAKRCREDPCATCGHYHDYENGEPCTICGHVLLPNKVQHGSVMPNTIVPGFLYLGNYDTASRQEILKAFNISHVLNTVATSQPLYRNTFTYHTASSNPPDFKECFDFLDGVHKAQSRVLVYCMSANSRSPAIVIGYLMKLHGWRLAEAYKWVKDKRPSINLSPADEQRLIELEQQMHRSCSVPFGFQALAVPALGASAPPSAQQPQQQFLGNAADATASVNQAAAPAFGMPSSTFKMGEPAAGGFVFGAAQVPQQPQQQQQHDSMES